MTREHNWNIFKQKTIDKDFQPFMAWRNGRVVHTAQFDPSSNKNFFDWLRQQESLAMKADANFVCYVLSSGNQEAKKI